MSGSNLIIKINAMKSCIQYCGLKLNYKRRFLVRKSNTSFLSFWNSYSTKIEDDKTANTHFQELMFSRKEQAERSVLFHISTKEDIPYALAKCGQYGRIDNVYSYSGERNNIFLLLEFSSKIGTQELFKRCQHQHINDIFPVFSRIIQYEKKSKESLPSIDIEIQEDNKTEPSLKKIYNVSEIIEEIYSSEKLTELDTRLRYFFCTLVKDSASGVFPQCDVFPFGSSVNGIGRRGCDLDAMIKLNPDDNSQLYSEKGKDGVELSFLNKTCAGQKAMQQKIVHFLGDYFYSLAPGITSVQKILHARMPILKMNHRLLKMDCDVSVNNMAAIFMSDIVHFCGEVDSRFRPLLYAVKKWAKEAEITHDKPGSWISNFGLTALVIYFFQKEGLLPPLIDALNIIGEESYPGFRLQYLKEVEEWRNFALQNKKSLAELFVEFFVFLMDYKFSENILSLMSGKARPQSSKEFPLWIQYPFDEDLNVTKNVSESELSELCVKAGSAFKSLEKKLNHKSYSVKDFSLLLGVHNLKKTKKTVDVSAYFDNYNKQRATKYRRLH